MKMAHIRLGLWKADVIVLHGGTQKEFKAFVLKEYGEHIDDAPYAQGQCFLDLDKGLPPTLWVERLEDTSTLVHELQHVVFRLLGFRGMGLAPNSEEAYTYTTSLLLETILNIPKRGWEKVK